MLFLLSACGRKKNPVTDAITNRDSVPVMTTRDVSTYISDSGVVRYKIIADEWRVYDRLDPSRWTFEEGIYLEKFNNDLSIEATIVADTAYYYDKIGLWQLYGNVRIHTIKNEKIFTDKLFWSSETERIYSDSHIRIEQQDQITEGIGFTANQNLTVWEILNTTGVYPIEEF